MEFTQDRRLDPCLIARLALKESDGESFMSGDPRGFLCTSEGSAWRICGHYFGGNEYINLGTVQDLNFERTDPFTVTAWIKTTFTGDFICTRQEGPSSYRGYAFATDPNGCVVTSLIHDNSTQLCTKVTGTTVVTDDIWHHVAVQNLALAGGAASDIRLFVDGEVDVVTVVADELGDNSIKSSAEFNVGGRHFVGTGEWNGLIGEIKVYNRVLSSLEIHRDYVATRRNYC